VVPTDPTILVNPVITDAFRQPTVNVRPAVGPAIGRLGARDLGRSAGAEGAQYYWIDDAGEAHAWQAEESASTEVWDDRVGQYYWVDDAGTVHAWPPTSGGTGG
jgi:hypothetical protein